MSEYQDQNKIYLAVSLFSVIVSYLLLNYTIIYEIDLDILSKIFSIIGTSTIGLALATYFYKKRQDQLLATIDQITFFREKIIPEQSSVSRSIKAKFPNFVFSRIDLTDTSIDSLRKKYEYNFERQLSAFFDHKSKYPDIEIHDILDKQVLLLNMLEEFSLRVIHLKTINNPALESLHNAFIEIIEHNAVALVFMRDIKTQNPIYSNVLRLYNAWSGKNKKPELIIRSLERNGLIDRKQKEDFYSTRKKEKGF